MKTTQPNSPVTGEAPKEAATLHGRFMICWCKMEPHARDSGTYEYAYSQGHRDARHAAAELVAAPQTSADYDWKAIAQHYEAALRHLAQSAFASKDWQYARDALASPNAAARLASAAPAAAAVEVPDERKAFEAWAAQEGYPIRRELRATDVYEDPRTHCGWHAWQEARDALSTQGGELPVAEVCSDEDSPWYVQYFKPKELLPVGTKLYARPTPAAAAGVPPGYVLVPRKLTDEMRNAAEAVTELTPSDTWEAIYAAMLAASGAPKEDSQK